MPIQWKEVFGGMFKAAEDHEAEQGTLLEGTVEQTERQPQPGVQLSAGLPPATYLPPTAPQESAEVAALKQQIAEERNARITAQADSFAEGMIASGHALPHEREHMTRLFRHAAEDDMDRPLAQSTTGAQASEGTPAPATRVGMLRASFEDRTPHGLTAETLPATTKLGVVSTPTTTAQMQGEQPLSEERRQKLLGSTPLGETILNGRHN